MNTWDALFGKMEIHTCDIEKCGKPTYFRSVYSWHLMKSDTSGLAVNAPVIF